MTDSAENSQRFGEISQIIEDFDSQAAGWKGSADDAWKEFKGGSGQSTATKKTRQRKYPLWWNTHKVRQNFIYSRRPDVVCQAIGDEPVIAHAASAAEKLAVQLMDKFPYSRVMTSARDDLLQTNVGICRVMFDVETVQAPAKVYLEQQEVEQQNPQTGEVERVTVLVGEDGTPIDPATAQSDADGRFYIEMADDLTEEISVVRTFLKPVDYSQFKWDYEAKEFSEWEWCAFETEMSTGQLFKQFGEDVLDKLKPLKQDGDDDLKRYKPRSKHKVVEFWCKSDLKRYIFVKGGSGFLAEDDDPYGLEKFFPVAFPMFDNLTTENTFPAIEFEQVRGILYNVSDIFDRKAQAMRLSRPRALYDSQIAELSTLINKARQGEYIGVPNLSSLTQQGAALVLYLDTAPILQAIQSLGAELQSELQSYDQVTGYSETLRGIVNPYESATGTERKSQFALSRFSNLQEDMQRFCRDNIRLLVDLCLAKTPDQQLWEMLEASLSDAEKEAWPNILKILRSDYKRSITIDIETDSTLMIDENAQKTNAQELMAIVGGFMQQVAQIAQQAPEMIPLALKTLEHLLRKVRGGRAFEEDITNAVGQMMEKIQQTQAQMAQNPQQDPNLLLAQAESQRVQNEGMKVQMDGQKAQMDFQVAMQKLQVDQLMTQSRLQTAQVDAVVKQSRLRLDEAKAQMDFVMKQEGLSQEQRKQAFEEYLQTTRLEMDALEKQLDSQARYMEEVRLANKVEVPDTVIIPPQQTNVITPELLVKDGV